MNPLTAEETLVERLYNLPNQIETSVTAPMPESLVAWIYTINVVIALLLAVTAITLLAGRWMRYHRDQQRPVHHLLHEGMGEDLPGATSLRIERGRNDAHTVRGLRPEQARGVVEWWTSSETHKNPEAALFILFGEVEQFDGSTWQAEQIVIIAQHITLMRTDTPDFNPPRTNHRENTRSSQ